MSKKIAAQIPSVLDAVESASQSTCPAMFVRSANDRIVPEKYQRMIFDAYAGKKSEFVLTGVDHHEGVPESQVKDYIRFIQQHAISIPQ